MNLLKIGLAGIVAVMAVTLFATTTPAKPVQGEPITVTALNEGNCIALGSAFGGLSGVVALTKCQGMSAQQNMQEYVHCLRGFDINLDGAKDCLIADPTLTPDDPNFPLSSPVIIRPAPSDFAALDIDANQIHQGIAYEIIAFVRDDFPVRFTSDKGTWFDPAGGVDLGKNYECDITNEDPDCDGDGTTDGDGVVVGRLKLLAADGVTGTVHINVIQENISFPIDLNIVGPGDTITLTPLFGKDTIQTGATPPTPGNCALELCENADPTDCNFAATVAGVLGANYSAEKAVVVAKALDNNGNEVIGTLLAWNHGFVVPAAPGINKGPLPQGGVALPQTPTVDLGAALGYGFPQFVCGGDTIGDLPLEVTFDGTYDSPTPAGVREKAFVTIHVVGPAVDMALAADPPAIDCNGTNTSKITATLTTAEGVPTANGLDVKFDVQTLGTVNPLSSDTGKGVASSVVTPLASTTSGVVVTVTAHGQIHELKGEEQLGPHQTFDDVVRSIVVACTGAPPVPVSSGAQPGGGGGNAGAGSGPGRITGPDTGSGGQAAAGSLTWSPLLGLVAAAMMLGGMAVAVRRIR